MLQNRSGEKNRLSEFDVLFIDDDPNILRGIKRNLGRRFNICTSETVDEALALIELNDFPVVVSDMQMPNMNGADFLILVKQLSPSTVRILLTGESKMQDAIKAINESGIYKFLTKPCPSELLIETVEQAMKLHSSNRLEQLILDKTVKGITLILVDVFKMVSPQIFKRNFTIIKKLREVLKNKRRFKRWDLEIACLLMYLGSVHYRFSDYDHMYKSENMSKVLLKSSEMLKKVPKFEYVSEILCNLSILYQGGNDIKKIDGESELLKLMIDYEYLKNDSRFLIKMRNLYSDKVTDEFPELFEKSLYEKSVSFDEVKLGHSVVQDVKTNSGAIIVKQGEIVSPRILSTVKIFGSKGLLVEPIIVLESKDA